MDRSWLIVVVLVFSVLVALLANLPIAALLVGLLAFGVGYNALVAWLERRKHDRGYTAFLVVGGTAVTLVGAIPLVGLVSVLWLLACFAASGLPMVIGSWARSSQERQADEEGAVKVAKEILDHAKAKGRGVLLAAGDNPSGECESGSQADA